MSKPESAERKALLRSPRLKIDRAKYHINDLNGKINAYLARDPFALICRIDPKAAKASLLVKAKKGIPDDVALTLGDAIHNLRSSLDLLAFNMVGTKTSQPKKVTFPFCNDAARLERAIKDSQMELAGKKVIDKIKLLKPYPGGDDLLYAVHSIDVSDKHHLLIPVGRTVGLYITDIKKVFPELPMSGFGAEIVVSGTHIFTVGVAFAARATRRNMRVVEYEPDIHPSFQICFGDGQTFAAQPVVAKLHAMVGRINDVIEALADAYV